MTEYSKAFIQVDSIKYVSQKILRNVKVGRVFHSKACLTNTLIFLSTFSVHINVQAKFIRMEEHRE